MTASCLVGMSTLLLFLSILLHEVNGDLETHDDSTVWIRNLKTSHRIVGGVKAVEGKYPWFVHGRHFRETLSLESVARAY